MLWGQLRWPTRIISAPSYLHGWDRYFQLSFCRCFTASICGHGSLLLHLWAPSRAHVPPHPVPLSISLCAALGHGADSEPTDAPQKLSSGKHAACCDSCWFSFQCPQRRSSGVVPPATLNLLCHACSQPSTGFPCRSTVWSCLCKSVPSPTCPLRISHIVPFSLSNFTRF